MIRMLFSFGRLGRGRLAQGLGLMDKANSIPVGTLKVKSSPNKDGVLNVPTNETFTFEFAYKADLVDINRSSVLKKRTSKTMKFLVFRLQLGNKSV